MRPFLFSGKTARQPRFALPRPVDLGCTTPPDSVPHARLIRAFASLSVAGLTLFSAVVKPRILLQPTSWRRSAGREGVIPDASPRQRQDFTTPHEGPQKNPGGGVCPFRYLALGRCRNRALQTRRADLRGHNRRRSRCRRRHHPVRNNAVRSSSPTWVGAWYKLWDVTV